jgi:aquaporin Z
MQAVDIGIKNALGGMALLKASFKKNWKFYLQEALGLAIFMVSACFFSVLFFGKNNCLHLTLQASARQSLLGIMMGLTALFIFYSRFTSPSGAHINPAVTLVFFRLRKIGPWDTLFYMIF